MPGFVGFVTTQDQCVEIDPGSVIAVASMDGGSMILLATGHSWIVKGEPNGVTYRLEHNGRTLAEDRNCMMSELESSSPEPS